MDERGQGYRQLKVQCPVLFHGAFTIQWQFYSRLQKDGLGLRLWSTTLLADIFGADKVFFRVWVPPTLPCPGQGPVAKGWRFFFCLTVLWQLSEWIENNWPFVWKSSECLGAYVWPQTLLTVPKSSKGTPLWTWPSKRQRKNFEIFNLDVDIDIDSGFVEDTDNTDNWNSER